MMEENVYKSLPQHQKFTAFREWLLKYNADIEKVRIDYASETNRKMRATKDIKKGDIVMNIPETTLICIPFNNIPKYDEDSIIDQVPDFEYLKNCRHNLNNPDHNRL
jgi:hypothetical protein